MLVGMLLALAPAADIVEPATPCVVTLRDVWTGAGKPQTVATGQYVVVVLVNIPGAGERWSVTEAKGLEQSRKATQVSTTEGPVVGAPAVSLFFFRAPKEGPASLTFGRHEPGKGKPVWEAKFRFDVRDVGR